MAVSILGLSGFFVVDPIGPTTLGCCVSLPSAPSYSLLPYGPAPACLLASGVSFACVFPFLWRPRMGHLLMFPSPLFIVSEPYFFLNPVFPVFGLYGSPFSFRAILAP